MPSRRDRVRLGHMLAHAQEAIVLTQGKAHADLDGDRLLNLAFLGSAPGFLWRVFFMARVRRSCAR